MSVQITTAMVEQYRANVNLTYQQKVSKLRAAVDFHDIVGEGEYVDSIGESEAIDVVSRHQDTPLVETPHVRRKLTVGDTVWADLIDRFDKPKLLIDPTSKYVLAAVAAMNRKIDSKIITAFKATAYGGRTGTTTYSFDTSNCQIAAASAGLTIAKIQSAKQKLDANEVPDEGRFFVLGSKQLDIDLLGTTQITSADYNTVKALVRGELDTFLGFTFIRSERLPVASSVRSCYAWCKQSMVLGAGLDIEVRVSERADKNYATQVWCGMSTGSSRMDEKGVIEVLCLES